MTRTTRNYNAKLTAQAALDNFLGRIKGIAMKEIADWRAQVREAMEPDEALQSVEETRKLRAHK